MYKRIFLLAGFLAILGLVFSFDIPPANAQILTIEEIRTQIADLLYRVAQLQRQLSQIQIDEAYSNIQLRHPPCGSYGDVNGDGYITSDDSSSASAVLSGNKKLTEEQASIADVNGNGQIDNDDVISINNYVNGNATTFPICLTE